MFVKAKIVKLMVVSSPISHNSPISGPVSYLAVPAAIAFFSAAVTLLRKLIPSLHLYLHSLELIQAWQHILVVLCSRMQLGNALQASTVAVFHYVVLDPCSGLLNKSSVLTSSSSCFSLWNHTLFFSIQSLRTSSKLLYSLLDATRSCF